MADIRHYLLRIICGWSLCRSLCFGSRLGCVSLDRGLRSVGLGRSLGIGLCALGMFCRGMMLCFSLGLCCMHVRCGRCRVVIKNQ